MKIIFFLDAKLIKSDGLYYTNGAVNKNYLERHKFKNSDKLIVVCREEATSNLKEYDNLSLASGENIEFITANNYKNLISGNIRKKIKNQIKDCDFCYIKLPSITSIMYYDVANKNIKKNIVEMVGCPWDSLRSHGSIKGKLLAPFMFFITKHYVKKSKNVIYVTNEFLQKRYPNKHHNIGCSDVILSFSDNEILQKRLDKIENNNGIYKLGLIGSLNVEYKGHETAIKAISKIKNKKIELHFLGSGNDTKWKELAKKYNIEKQVFFDGTLPSGQAVYDWIDELDLFLIPSLTEGLPRALVEAMSRACPVIGSSVGGIPELLGNKYLHKKKDFIQLAKMIEDVLNNKDIMKEMAKKNYEKSLNFEKQRLDKLRKDFVDSVINDDISEVKKK